jgi:hypothetical protein
MKPVERVLRAAEWWLLADAADKLAWWFVTAVLGGGTAYIIAQLFRTSHEFSRGMGM